METLERDPTVDPVNEEWAQVDLTPYIEAMNAIAAAFTALTLGAQRLQESVTEWIDAWDDALAVVDYLADLEAEPEYITLLVEE